MRKLIWKSKFLWAIRNLPFPMCPLKCSSSKERPRLLRHERLVATVALLLMVSAGVSAQNKDHDYRGQGYFFFGLGTGTGYRQRPFFKHMGGGGEGFLYQGLGFGAELGHATWGGDYRQAWVGSADFSYHFRRRAARGTVDPFVVMGVTGVFPTTAGRGASAGNFGGGANLWLTKQAALRFEFRDVAGAHFWIYSHYLSFRVGMTFR